MERSRRTIVAPKRFSIDGEVGLPAASRDYRTRLLRHVYRPLKRKEITKELATHEVHLFWPNDQKWYRAHIEKIFFKDQKAYVHYPDDDTYEELDLGELIKEKHIAIVEARSAAAKLRPGEMPVEQDAPVEYDDDASESSADIDSDEWVLESDLDDDDDDELSDSADEADQIEAKEAAAAARREKQQRREDAEKKRRSQHKQVSRSKTSATSAARPSPSALRPAVSAPDAQQLQLKRLKPTSHGATPKVPALRPVPAVGSSGPPAAAAAPAAPTAPAAIAPPAGLTADDYTSALVGMLMEKIGQTGASASDPTAAAATSTSTAIAAPTTMLRAPVVAKLSSAALPPATAKRKEHEAEGDDDVRRRVREQLAAALSVAAEELKRATSATAPGDELQQPPDAPGSNQPQSPLQQPRAAPETVAEEIEAELYAANGASVSKEYKAKLRSLLFNLKDAKNPDLRARVLQREVPSARLVRMSAMELASRDLNAWRLKKSEEFEKAKFLDVEAAAKFSTAAAQQLAARRQAALAAAAPDKRPGLDLLVENKMATGSAPPDMEPTPPAQGAPDGSLVSPRGAEVAANGHGALEATSDPAGAGAAGADDQTTRVHVSKQAKVTLKPVEVEPGTIGAAEGEGELYDPNDYYTSTYDSGGDPLDLSTTAGLSDGSGGLEAVGKAALSPRGGSKSSAVADVPDLAPCISRHDEPGGAMQRRGMSVRPADEVWHGLVRLPDTGTLALRCCYVGGMGDLGSMLGDQPLDVKGTVRLEKFEPFLEELRSKSRSRTVTLGILKPPATSTPIQAQNTRTDCAEAMLEMSNHYSTKARTGVCHPLPGLECYILANGHVAARLLKTARLVTPVHLAHLLPPGGNVAPGELLVAVIHRRDFMAPPLAPRPLAPAAPLRMSSTSSIELPSFVSSDPDNPGEAGGHARYAPFSPPSDSMLGAGRPHDPRARPNDPRLNKQQQQQQPQSQPQQQMPLPPSPLPAVVVPQPAPAEHLHHHHPHQQHQQQQRQQQQQQHQQQEQQLQPQLQRAPPAQAAPSLDLSGLGALAASLGIASAALPDAAAPAAAPSTHPVPAGPMPTPQEAPPLDLSSLAALAGALGALGPTPDQSSSHQPQLQQQQQQQMAQMPHPSAPHHPSPLHDQQAQQSPRQEASSGTRQFALARPGSDSMSLVTMAADGTVLVAPLPPGPLPPGVMLLQRDEVAVAAATAGRTPDADMPRLEPMAGPGPGSGLESGDAAGPPLLMGPESRGILAKAQQLLEGGGELVAEPPAPHGMLGPMRRDTAVGPYSEQYNADFFQMVAMYEQQLAEAGPILPLPQFEQQQQQQQQQPEAGPAPAHHQELQYHYHGPGANGGAGSFPGEPGVRYHEQPAHTNYAEASRADGYDKGGLPPGHHTFEPSTFEHAAGFGAPPYPHGVTQSMPVQTVHMQPGVHVPVRPPMPPPGPPPAAGHHASHPPAHHQIPSYHGQGYEGLHGSGQVPYHPDRGWQPHEMPGHDPSQSQEQAAHQRGRTRSSRWE